MPFKQNKLLCAWMALTLATLFFYPLFATLNDNTIILQWSLRNSLELISAVLVLACLLSAVLWLISNNVRNIIVPPIFFFLIFTIFFIPFTVHILQQLGFKGTLITIGEYAHANLILTGTLVVICTILLLLLIAQYPKMVGYCLILTLLSLSSLNFLAGWVLWRYGRNNTITEISNTARITKHLESTPRSSFVVILFDELSYDYLYKNGSINERYTNFKKLASISDNYHLVTSPGDQTLTAIPGLLTTHRYDKLVMKYDWIYKITKQQKEEYLKIGSDNLFNIAKTNGFKTYACGNYLPYCEMFGQYLDECRSFSEYNYATMGKNFSILNPIITVLNIWPRQKPQGFLKNIAASLVQKKRMEQTFNFTEKALEKEGPIMLFSHVYLPHLPFVFSRIGYYENPEPFLQNDDNYRQQLDYADIFLGRITDIIKRNGSFELCKIVVLSDHNYRIQFPGRENVIPMIVKHPYQRTKRDIFEPTHAEEALRKELLAIL